MSFLQGKTSPRESAIQFSRNSFFSFSFRSKISRNFPSTAFHNYQMLSKLMVSFWINQNKCFKLVPRSKCDDESRIFSFTYCSQLLDKIAHEIDPQLRASHTQRSFFEQFQQFLSDCCLRSSFISTRSEYFPLTGKMTNSCAIKI